MRRRVRKPVKKLNFLHNKKCFSMTISIFHKRQNTSSEMEIFLFLFLANFHGTTVTLFTLRLSARLSLTILISVYTLMMKLIIYWIIFERYLRIYKNLQVGLHFGLWPTSMFVEFSWHEITFCHWWCKPQNLLKNSQ